MAGAMERLREATHPQYYEDAVNEVRDARRRAPVQPSGQVNATPPSGGGLSDLIQRIGEEGKNLFADVFLSDSSDGDFMDRLMGRSPQYEQELPPGAYGPVDFEDENQRK